MGSTEPVTGSGGFPGPTGYGLITIQGGGSRHNERLAIGAVFSKPSRVSHLA